MVKLEDVEHISHESVKQWLKKRLEALADEVVGDSRSGTGLCLRDRGGVECG